MAENLPYLTEEGKITINTLMDLFFKQFWAFSEYLNDTNGIVETYKYADYVLYSFGKTLKELYPQLDKGDAGN